VCLGHAGMVAALVCIFLLGTGLETSPCSCMCGCGPVTMVLAFAGGFRGVKCRRDKLLQKKLAAILQPKSQNHLFFCWPASCVAGSRAALWFPQCYLSCTVSTQHTTYPTYTHQLSTHKSPHVAPHKHATYCYVTSFTAGGRLHSIYLFLQHTTRTTQKLTNHFTHTQCKLLWNPWLQVSGFPVVTYLRNTLQLEGSADLPFYW